MNKFLCNSVFFNTRNLFNPKQHSFPPCSHFLHSDNIYVLALENIIHGVKNVVKVKMLFILYKTVLLFKLNTQKMDVMTAQSI